MKEFEINAINMLVNVYSRYINEGLTKEVTELAEYVESQLLNSSSLVSALVSQAVGKLTDFYAKTGFDPPTKDQSKIIVRILEMRKEELELQ